MVRFKQVFRERDDRSEDGSEELLSVSAYTGVSPRRELVEDGDHLSRAESLEGYKRCQPDDLVMNIMLAWNRGLGFAKQSGIVSPAYCVFQVVDGSSPRFLEYLLRADETIGYFKAFSAGVIDSRLRLYPDAFLSLSCALPPPAEQAAIAGFLDRETGKIDALVEEQRRLIALLKEKRQAVISHAVTKGLDPCAPLKDSGVEWMGEVPAHWKVCSAKRVAHVFVPQRNKPELNPDGIGVCWVTMDDMRKDDIRETPRYVSNEAAAAAGSNILPVGSVIASCVGNFGVASINRADVIINQQLQAYLPSASVCPEWLVHWVRVGVGYFEQVATAATLPYVNQVGFGGLPLTLPSVEEQRAILSDLTRQVDSISNLVREAEAGIALLQERRAALISAAVTGKIDVRGLAPAEAEAA